MRLHGVGLAAGLALLGGWLGGCGTQEIGEPSTWAEPPNYEYVLDSRCGEQLLHGRMKITITAGKVTAADGLDEAGENTLSAVDGRLELMPTLGELMSHYELARTSGADIALVEYDGAGHPSKITVDGSRNSIDDELCYTITGYQETEPS